MNMAATRKIEEALAHIKEAEKCLKTGLMKWNPDYDMAADEYNKAAVCYKSARSHPQCVQCYVKASENYYICKTYFAAAKALENASTISKEMGEFDMVAQFAERSCKLYRDHGTVDTAATMLDRAAKIIEGTRPLRAMDLYKQAVDIALCEGTPSRAAEYQTKLCRLLVRLQMFSEAAESIKSNMTYFRDGEYQAPIGRECVALVLVQLARGDTVAAQKAFRDWGDYCESQEVDMLARLLDAFDEQDGDACRKMLRSPFIRSMDVEYSKLARDMATPASSKKADVGGSGSSNGGGAVGGAEGGVAASADGDEMDLC